MRNDLYKVIKTPYLTEKVSSLMGSNNQYAFKVSVDATKAEIREAIETIFKVSVKNVSTVNVKGKTKKTARGMSRKKNWKKAYVTVAQGQELDYMVAE